MLIQIDKNVFIPTDIIISLYVAEDDVANGIFVLFIEMIGRDDIMVSHNMEYGEDGARKLFSILKEELHKRDLKVVKL